MRLFGRRKKDEFTVEQGPIIPVVPSTGGRMECVPAFFFKGEELIEVAYTEWEETDPEFDNWLMRTGAVLTVDKEVDRVIFETPVGCFETIVSVKPGQVVFNPPGVSGVTPNAVLDVCYRTRAARSKLAEELVQ